LLWFCRQFGSFLCQSEACAGARALRAPQENRAKLTRCALQKGRMGEGQDAHEAVVSMA
jgi:hypothetical protein